MLLGNIQKRNQQPHFNTMQCMQHALLSHCIDHDTYLFIHHRTASRSETSFTNIKTIPGMIVIRKCRYALQRTNVDLFVTAQF